MSTVTLTKKPARVALGRDGEAEVVQGAARLSERAARELRGSGR